MLSINQCLFEKQENTTVESKLSRSKTHIPDSPVAKTGPHNWNHWKKIGKYNAQVSRVLHLSDSQRPCTTLSTWMPLSSPVSLSSVSRSWVDICQLYSSGYFDVARYNLTHFHNRHESIFCIDNKICSCLMHPFFGMAYTMSSRLV